MSDVDQLHLSPSDRAILRSFVGAWFEHGQPVLFAGAGLSKNATRRPTAPKTAEFLSWSQLTALLGGDLTGGDAQLEKRLPSNDLRLAELHQAQLHRQLLLDRIAQAVPSEHFEPGEVHEQLARLPWAALVTTNYDDLLERAFVRRRVRKVVWDTDLTQRRSPDDLLIVKMHGDLCDGRSIVLTEEDYRRYPATRPGVTVKVKQLLLEHPLLFVGFSLTDPNFTNIDGWIRDTVDAVKLPSVALMRPPVLPAERVMWQRRGVHVLAIEDDLKLVLGALEGESASRSGRRSRRDRGTPADTSNAVLQLLEKRPAGWHKQLAAQLEKLTQESDGGSLALRFALDGRLQRVALEDVLEIVGALDASARRRVLIHAYSTGLTEVRGFDQVAFDVASELLRDGALSTAERVDVLLQRARIARRQRDLPCAQRDVKDARDLAKGKEIQDRVDLEMRELVLLLDDAEEMKRLLIAPPIEGHAFAYCRRGADALALLGPEGATQWYRKALELALNGDESTAALMGSQACLDWRKEHARVEELQRSRFAIRPEDRPRAEHVWQQRGLAGERFMSGRRELAITELRQAIEEAEQMGWPRSVQFSSSTSLDQIVDDTIRLLLADDASFDEMKEAFNLVIRNGRRIDADNVPEKTVARLLAKPGAAEWLRELLKDRPSSPPLTRRARDLLASACLPALADDAIEGHVARVFLEPMARFDVLDDESRGELAAHLKLLSRSWWFLPATSVAPMLGVAVRALSGGRREQDILDLPLGFWAAARSVAATDEVVTSLVDAIIAQLDGEGLLGDWHRRRSVVLLVGRLREVGLLANHLDRVREALAALLTRSLSAEMGERKESVLLDLVGALGRFEAWAPTESLAAAIVDLYPLVRNSTSAGQWAIAIERTVAACPPTHVAALSQAIREYVRLAKERPPEERFVYRPQWAAWMLTAVVGRGADVIPKEEATSSLRELAQKDPVVALSIAEAGLGMASETELREAEEFVLRTWMQTSDSQDNIVGAWSGELHADLRPSEAIEERLLAHLVAHDPAQRMDAYHALRLIAERDHLSLVACERLLRTALRFGTLDPHYFVRCAATRALGRVGGADIEVVTARLTDLQDDVLAPVRRCAAVALAQLATP